MNVGSRAADVRAQQVRDLAWRALWIFAIVLAASLLGIATRSAGALASVWPANALLVGLMVRDARRAHWICWLSATAGFLAADLLTGATLAKTLLLTSGNLIGIAIGYALYLRLDEDHRRLRRPLSVLFLALVACICAGASGVVGAIAGPIYFASDAWSGWAYWFGSELVDYIAILPAVLTAPQLTRATFEGWRMNLRRARLRDLAPALAMVASCVIAMLIGGAGAIAFPVPALLWCAIAYNRFATAALTLLFGVWTLYAISRNYLPLTQDAMSAQRLLSVRVGVTFVALGPIAVASVMSARDELLQRLAFLASHDPMTGLLNRRAFCDEARAQLGALAAGDRAAAVLMIDIDRFKSINDTYGHAVGDKAIESVGRALSASLGRTALLGRLGGEEFAALLRDRSPESVAAVAEAARLAVSAAPIGLGADGARSVTVSIGVAFAMPAPDDLDHLLSVADRALYDAKRGGRNRVAGAGPSGALPQLLKAMRGDPSDENRRAAGGAVSGEEPPLDRASGRA